MKNKRAVQSGFFSFRVLAGLLIAFVGAIVAVLGFGTFDLPAAGIAQTRASYSTANSMDALIPPGFDCSKIHELGIDKQMNLRARAIMSECDPAERGSASPSSGFSKWIQNLLPIPLTYGGADVDLITGTETWSSGVYQSTTFSWVNPDNTNHIVISYNDVRCATRNYSGASVSTDGGTTFTRLTNANGCSPFASAGTNYGDPVTLYNRPTGYWYTIWLDVACGGQGIGYYKSTTPWDVNSWTHGCIHNGPSDDRESGWTDMNSSSPFYGRMYVSWNDFNRSGGAMFVRYSDDGVTWMETGPLPGTGNTFIRNVQITGDLVTGDVYVAGMNEGGGGLGQRSNLMFRSTDGGASFTNTYTGPYFFGPGRCGTGYFAAMYCSPSPGWVNMGWGQPAAINHVVHYVYTQCGQNVPCNTATDHGDVYYIRSTDSGVTFSAPLKLNTDTGTAAQWEPNLSVSANGSLFAVWYDERTGGTCTAGANTPCYQMFARRSDDNGLTWLPDMEFSDVVSPLPALSQTGSVAGSDYDYQIGVATTHRTAWMDGRVAIDGIQQPDAFTDSEPTGAGTPTPSPSSTATATSTPTATPTATPRPSPTPRIIPTPRPRPTAPPRP